MKKLAWIFVALTATGWIVADHSLANDQALLTPPKSAGPAVVRASFQLNGLNEINEQAETFEFSGVLTLEWRDERQAFDPVVAGTAEKVYQGEYQFDEISPAWFPQVVLVNQSGLYEKHGAVLRVKPDGTSTLVETVNAVAKTNLDLHRFPFDRQRLAAVFEVLGFDSSEVILQAKAEATRATRYVWIPQWIVRRIDGSTTDFSAPYAGPRGVASAFVLTVHVQRDSFFISRLIVLPLVVIVFLSFSVFWMDRSSLGDRISVSFIGILTGVTYQLVMSDLLPRISYVTLMNAFLNISFLTMCGTVVINLVVGTLDKQNKSELGDRIDHRCRWIFPIAYIGLLLLAIAAMFLFF